MIGIDIEEVSRFKSLIRNRRFLKRVFTPQEIAYCSSKANKTQHFAVRFAAKEAIWKALSDTLRKKRSRLSHRDIGIKNEASGRPTAVLPKSLARIAKKISISLSHSRLQVVAVAVLK